MRFIFVDDIVEMVPGKVVRGVKTLHASEDLFRDHFPGFPVVPGVLLTEMMAQTAGKCLDAEEPGRGKAMLAQIRKASFRRWVRPDERVDIHAEITSNTAACASASCQAAVGGEKVAEADLLFSFVPHARFAPGFRDDVLERFLRRPGDERAESSR